MDIIKEISSILTKHQCKCFYLDEKNLLIKHNLTMDEARENICNHRVFTEITGFLVVNHIDFEVTDNHDIQIVSTKI